MLTTKARISAPAAKCFLHKVTGAAQNWFLVKTPATRVPSLSLITNTSLRFGLRILASAKPNSTPLTGNKVCACGAERLTGIRISQGGYINSLILTDSADLYKTSRNIEAKKSGIFCRFY